MAERDVFIKLPQFWEHAVEAWFAHVEAHFACRQVRDGDLKYYHVVAALGSSASSSAAYDGLSGSLSGADTFLRLLAEFPDLLLPTFSALTTKHGVEHHITTEGHPVYARARRLNPSKLAVARAATMERLGIVRRSDSSPGLPRPSGFSYGTRRRLSLQFRPLSREHQGLKFPRSYARLGTFSSVTMHTEAPCSPLQPPYDGPFWVLEHGDKHLVLDMGGKAEHVSVDRVKAAHLDVDQPVVLARPPRRGRPPALIPVRECGPVVPVPPLTGAVQAEVTVPAPLRRTRGVCLCLSQLLGQAARNMVIQEDAILHSEDSLRKMSIITTHLQYQQEAIQKNVEHSKNLQDQLRHLLK
nr:PREDICTED: UPF0693 protein C10orf32 homolog [Notothenia coriiceps]